MFLCAFLSLPDRPHASHYNRFNYRQAGKGMCQWMHMQQLIQTVMCDFHRWVCIVFQAYGMSVLPLNLIKGTRSVAYERLENTEDIDDVEHQIEKLKSKVGLTS